MLGDRMGAPAVRSRFEQLADHPWLVGDVDAPGAQVLRRVRRLTIAAIVSANAVGALVVACFALWVLPKPGLTDDGIVAMNIQAAVVYVMLALAIGIVWGRRRLEGGPHGLAAWLPSDRPPGEDERLRVLRAPLRIMAVEVVLWGVAVVVFAVLNARYSGLLALGVALTVGLGGLTTSAAVQLLCELALRPVASRALAHGAVERTGIPGVATRWLMAWALGSGVPVVGVVLVGLVALTSVDISEQALAVTMLALGGLALVFGATLSVLAAYATVHPIRSIRDGLERVRRGQLDVELGVWDSTEMGLLQAGFNDMVAGLRERERIRDVFGRHVGADVARRALSDGTRLGGEVRDVTVLFVDLAGSTALAAEHEPEDTVALLNRFFAEVVDVVESCGGWINKFQGDAALAIFGAPLPVQDAAGRGLRAARRLDERLRSEVPELTAGIGVATGAVVAGNVGAEQRLEYTVIGDPVNAAARLTDLAKQHPARVLASADVVAAAQAPEAESWELGDEVVLRGRRSPTRLAHPRG
jgi:adenylate cyclase